MKLTKWPYVKKPLFTGVLTGTGAFIFCYFQEIEKLMKITSNLNNVIITITLTFIAFSVTALSLLSFVYNQDWFKKIAKSIYFQSFIDRFLLSTKCSIILLIIAVICLFFDTYYNIIICSVINAVFIFSVIFLSLWIWKCLDDLIDIFKG